MAKYKTNASFLVGQTETNTVFLNEGVLTGIVIAGSTITGSTLTFLVSHDGQTFYPLYDSDSTEVTLTVAGSPRGYNLNPSTFMPWNFVKGRLGNSASAVAATSNASLVFIMDNM